MDGNWVLYDLWDAHQTYNDDCIILPFQSTYDELETVKKGTKFANIIGSTYDPKPKGAASWIGLMEAVYKAEGKKDMKKMSRCCTDGKVYVDDKKCDCYIKEVMNVSSRIPTMNVLALTQWYPDCEP